jgi:uncharacterized protein with HEPN domain
MSEPAPRREWNLYVADMVSYAEKIIRYTDNLNQKQFEQDSLVYDATIRNLELLGEAATHLPTEVREHAIQIPWRQIIGMRNRLIHGDLGIDNDIVWSAIKIDIPAILPELRSLQSK